MAEVETPAPACGVAARVVAAAPICRQHVSIECELPAFPPSEPGQFVQLLCRDVDHQPFGTIEWRPGGWPILSSPEFRGDTPYLRRPFSIADRCDLAGGAVRLRFLARVVGPGTRWLESLRIGGTLDLTGPLGRGFQIPTGSATSIVLIGGGVGVPPLLYLARRLWSLGERDVTVFFGARSGALLPVELTGMPAAEATPVVCASLPGGATYPAVVATDDGSLGFHGRVTDALWQWAQRRQASAKATLVCACGPEAMLREVARITRERGFTCQLCIERHMGCGLGTCLSCVVRVRDAGEPRGWRWALACQDGPVFQRDDLLDYAEGTGA